MTAPACRWTLVAAVSMNACIRIPERDLRLVDAGGAPDAERAADAVPAPDDGGRPAPDASSVADAAVATDSAAVVDAASAMDGGTSADAQLAVDGGTSVKDAGTPVEAEVDAGMPRGFALVPEGSFTMGTPGFMDACPQQDCETPHRVQITRAFLIGTTEVTVGEWNAVMVGSARAPLVGCAGGDDCPVTNVSWREAVDYCIARSLAENKPNCYMEDPLEPSLRCEGYRLPTEAEWEFAARGGTMTPTWFEGVERPLDVNAVGWSAVNSGMVLHEVGELEANPYGLFDIYGNAGEWVHDWRVGDYGGLVNVIDPLGGVPQSTNSGMRGVRGGSFGVETRKLRSAYRGALSLGRADAFVGFRVVLGLPDGSAQ